MWYNSSIRRHLCDMHIDDWNPEFLSAFSPEDYLENLKKAKIQNAMLYFQSHVGLCYYPTKTGKMHRAFAGREDAMKRLAELCRREGIAVTGYYSLIYNNWAYRQHPDWRIVDKNGNASVEASAAATSEFSNNRAGRYGTCCPNNPDYRAFVSAQIEEIAGYFTFDAMFFDMLFWPDLCYCAHCKARWEREVGGALPEEEDYSDPKWLLHIQKRREWMGAFAQSVTDELKRLAPGASVEHNCASAALPDGRNALGEEVVNACDYVGGDLYGGPYRQSFTCKFYRNITKNQPFEYMFSRCKPALSSHTVTKSKDEMRSAVFLTAAHHGATLVIDAIDPVGTMDGRVYEQIGEVFEQERPYEQYFQGSMIEDVGIYYTLRSKFNAHGEPYTNHMGAVHAVETMIFSNISCGVTGGYHDIGKYKILIAPCLTDEDAYDAKRIAAYVENGGCLYFSGGDSGSLLRAFFGAECIGRTKERVVYVAPDEQAGALFDYFNKKYPLPFDGTAPIVRGLDDADIIARLTLPYTDQDTAKFASIHSNPPGIPTDLPAMAYKTFGKGRVLWSALPLECVELYDYRRILTNILKHAFNAVYTFTSDAPKDVELIGFQTEDAAYISAVLLNEDDRARKVEDFRISVKCQKRPAEVVLLPERKAVPFSYENGEASFWVEKLPIFAMYQIRF